MLNVALCSDALQQGWSPWSLRLADARIVRSSHRMLNLPCFVRHTQHRVATSRTAELLSPVVRLLQAADQRTVGLAMVVFRCIVSFRHRSQTGSTSRSFKGGAKAVRDVHCRVEYTVRVPKPVLVRAIKDVQRNARESESGPCVVAAHPSWWSCAAFALAAPALSRPLSLALEDDQPGGSVTVECEKREQREACRVRLEQETILLFSYHHHHHHSPTSWVSSRPTI